MRKLATLSLTLAVLVGSAGQGFALPECPGSYNKNIWTNCIGTYTFADGNKYVGEFKDGTYHGQGTVTVGNLGDQGKLAGTKYIGEWKNGKRHGQGTLTLASGNKYVGEFRDGETHGQGTETLSKGGKYVGEHRNDKPHGHGTYTFADGEKYVGEVKNGLPNGLGTLIFADSRKVNLYAKIGELTIILNDFDATPEQKEAAQNKISELEGEAKAIYSIEEFNFFNEAKVDYEVLKDMINNPYTSYYSKSQAKSALERLEIEARTIISNAGRKEYVGEFKDGKGHGQGTLTYADGRVEEGIWEDDKFKYAQKISPTQRQPTQTPSNHPLEKAEKKCAEIGFTKGTEKYGDCVMKLLN